MADPYLIVLTAASGKQCSHIIPHLYADPSVRLRLICNTNESHARLEEQYPRAQVLRANLTSPNNCHHILKDATKVLHVGPGFHPREAEIGKNMVAAAQRHVSEGSPFKHFVYSSVLHTQLRKLSNHDCKRPVEEALMESGLNYTILQPTTFLENIPIGNLVKEDDDNITFSALWNPDVKFSMLALKDLGEIGRKVLKEGQLHYYAEYALTSTWPVSQRDVLLEASRVAKKGLKIEKKGVEEAAGVLRVRVFKDQHDPDNQDRDGPKRMIQYYNERGLLANPRMTEWLLGRKPTGYQEWVRYQIEGAI